MFPHRHPNLNALWSALLLEELWRLGVRDICIAPGSRSAPLTLVAAELDKLTKHVHFDERGLGFYALGLAKSSGRPVVVITTSGSAVANLYPALVEARQSCIPLILLTADRPPELIVCGANQAINQHGIFAQYPEASLMLPAPDIHIASSWLLGSIDHAFAQSCSKQLPLHINCMFREPLYPDGTDQDFSDYLKPMRAWLSDNRVFKQYKLPECSIQFIDPAWREARGLIIAGRLSPEESPEEIISLAHRLGWPVIADLQSQLHGHPDVLKHADLLPVTAKGKELISQATHVIQFGGHLISKRLGQFLSGHDWQHYILVNRAEQLLDPGHNQTLQLSGMAGEVCRQFLETLPTDSAASHNGVTRWAAAFDILSEHIEDTLKTLHLQEKRLTERWVGQQLTHSLDESANLFVGNSLPVRLLDMFSAAQVKRLFTNRGASGIDGLIASAAGCAAGLSQPLVAIIGDLSFLHDLNSLALLRNLTAPLVLIVMNNDGGGIFSMLPGEKSASVAKDYFQTPHGLSCRAAAEMFSLNYVVPVNQADFKVALEQALDINACTLVEVITEPGEAAVQIKESIRQLENMI